MINEAERLQCWRCDQYIELGENFAVVESPNRPGLEFPTCLGCALQLTCQEPPEEDS